MGVLFTSFERRVCLILIGLCFLVQVGDSWPALAINRSGYLAKVRPAVLASPFWGTVADRYDKIIYVLPRDGVENYIPLCFFAAQHHLPVNIGHCARIDDHKLVAAQMNVLKDIENGPLNSKALYVFDTAALWDLGLKRMSGTDWAGVVDGFKVIAPGWGREAKQNTVSTLKPVLREYRIGSQILFTGAQRSGNFWVMVGYFPGPKEYGPTETTRQ